MIKTIALDDEPPALDILGSFCSLTDYLDLLRTFTRAEEAMKYLSAYPVDLLFLDINMPSISGLDFRKQIPADTMVIFTTAYSEFAVEGFTLNAVDYLLKPIAPERFLQAAEKARSYYQFLHQNSQAKPDHINIRVDYSLVKVALDDILYIEGMDDYLRIYLANQKPLMVRMRMKVILEMLPQSDFVRVHRSWIVPLAKIDSLRNKMLLVAGKGIPLGTSYEEGFNEVFSG